MQFIGAIVIGGIIGALAKLFMPGKDPGGLLVTILLGIAGGIIAGFIGRMAGWYHPGLNGPGVIASIAGAMLLLAAYRMYLGRRPAI